MTSQPLTFTPYPIPNRRRRHSVDAAFLRDLLFGAGLGFILGWFLH